MTFSDGINCFEEIVTNDVDWAIISYWVSDTAHFINLRQNNNKHKQSPTTKYTMPAQ